MTRNPGVPCTKVQRLEILLPAVNEALRRVGRARQPRPLLFIWFQPAPSCAIFLHVAEASEAERLISFSMLFMG